MHHWIRRNLIRISEPWIVVVSFATGVAETALLHTWLWPPAHQTSSLSSGSEISLQILPKGTGLLVQWNPQSLPVLRGYSGLLTVQDGGRQVRVPLDRSQLQAGSSFYTPTSEWAEFRLEIYRDGNHYSGEAMALATGLKVKGKPVPVDEALVYDVPQPSSEAPQLTLSAASSGSKRLEARPFHGSAICPGVVKPPLRQFSPATLFAATNISVSAIVEGSPPTVNLPQNNTSVILPVDSELPSAVPDLPLPSDKVGKLSIRSYDGIILDAACDTLTDAVGPDDPHRHCAVSVATTTFAIRLEDGHTLRFDSVGNLRAQNAKRKSQWVAKTLAGKKIHAKVTGAVAGDDLIVLSIE